MDEGEHTAETTGTDDSSDDSSDDVVNEQQESEPGGTTSDDPSRSSNEPADDHVVANDPAPSDDGESSESLPTNTSSSSIDHSELQREHSSADGRSLDEVSPSDTENITTNTTNTNTTNTANTANTANTTNTTNTADTTSGNDTNLGSSGRDRSSPDVDLDGVVLDDDNQGLFDDLLSGEPIFENKEVLRPSYTPHELPHRNDQINRMATILVSALRGETPSNILIYGKTGTGKTASAKFVSQELESTSQKYDVPCEVEYINCEVTDTQYRVLAQLANTFIEKNQAVIEERIERYERLRSSASEDPSALEQTEFSSTEAIEERIERLQEDADEMEEVPMTGWPTDRVYTTFFDAVDYHERVVVIMLDEIDKLVEKSGDDTLYNLSRMNSELDNSRISIMGISNDLKFTDFLDPRVKSSLGEEEIVFPPYDANQLRDILQHRADIAFKPDALTDDVIPLCAAFAAQEHGDARRALDLLRTAGELAERSQAEIVAEKHVRQAQDKIELDRVVEVVRTLPTQSKIVLFAVILLEKNGVHNINTGEVFNIYKRLCEEIDADVLTQRRVTDLISELDMLGIVNAVVVSKGRYGRTKEMGLSVPVEETEAVLLSDSRLGDIENAQPFVQARFDN